jgi:Na+-driven multidrug efflux pump
VSRAGSAEGERASANATAGQVLLLAAGMSLVIGGVGWLSAGPMLALMGASPAVFYAYGMVLVQAFNGAGDARTPTVLNFMCFWCFKIPLAHLLAVVLGMGQRGVFVSITCAYSRLAALAWWFFRAGRWKRSAHDCRRRHQLQARVTTAHRCYRP